MATPPIGQPWPYKIHSLNTGKLHIFPFGTETFVENFQKSYGSLLSLKTLKASTLSFFLNLAMFKMNKYSLTRWGFPPFI